MCATHMLLGSSLLLPLQGFPRRILRMIRKVWKVSMSGHPTTGPILYGQSLGDWRALPTGQAKKVNREIV